jgi:hypothetical protein
VWGLSAVGMWGGNLPLRAQATLQMCDSAAVGRRTDFTAGDIERAIGESAVLTTSALGLRAAALREDCLHV